MGHSGRALGGRGRSWEPLAVRVQRGVLTHPGLAGARAERASPGSPRTCPMAARVVAWEALGDREVPTPRPTPGAGLEAAGALELELEEEPEEDEEEAEARRARTFAQDARVRFLGGRLELMLGLGAEKWSQHLESEDHRQVLGEFLESPGPACLVFSVAAAGQLEASQEVRSDGRGTRLCHLPA